MSLNPSCEFYLGLDISLSSPGFAVIRVANRRAELVDTFRIKTNPNNWRGVRYERIERFFFEKLQEWGYEYTGIIRESFHSRIPDTNASVFGAWASVDRALVEWKMKAQDSAGIVTHQFTAQQVKKLVAGKARAEKDEVADAVRTWLRIPNHGFASNDESDACAIVLAHLIKEGLIDG